MWVTMGPIADRTHERLGASDLAVVEFRKQMLDAVRAFQAGAPAIGTGQARIPASVCSYQAIVPKTTDWRVFPAAYVWTPKSRRWSRRIRPPLRDRDRPIFMRVPGGPKILFSQSQSQSQSQKP